MKKIVGKFIMRLMGWELVGEVPAHLKKYVLIAAPHTSNMDFFLAIPSLWIMDLPFRFLIKREHTDAFYGGIIKALGGIGVDRENQSLKFVEQLKHIVATNSELAFLFTPEGTRSWVKRWKTGFYRVAQAGEVPVVLAAADYKNKKVIVGEVLYPTGDLHKDLLKLEEYYAQFEGKFPENFNNKFFER
jgi:1-acyl-sn-glycerol-3-phosphate acyltransferase